MKTLALAIVVVAVATWVYNLALFLGFHVIVHNHRPGPCKILPGIEHGSEDFGLLPGDKVLISSGLRPTGVESDIKAAIFLFDFNKPDVGVERVTINNFPQMDDSNFHGISTYYDKGTKVVSVFVVNHLPAESVVEVFTYRDSERALYYMETLGQGDSNFRLMNDVTAVGPRQFYFTNYFHYRSMIELVLQLDWGSVVYYDGKDSHVMSKKGFTIPNGIAHSAGAKYVYMAHSFNRELVTFTRKEDNSLAIKERTPLYILPDNVIVDHDNGDIWVAGHPVGYQNMQHYNDPSQPSPSMVLRLRTKDGLVTDVSSVLADDGRMFSASSVALYRKQQLLVGSINCKLMLCDVQYI